MSKRGLLIVLSGPSGVGKGTLLHALLRQNSNMYVSVSATTREPREGEEDGKDYYFIDKDDFKTMVDNGEMLEYAVYGGNFYGTPKFAVEEHLANGDDVILEIEVQGAMQIKEHIRDAVLIFVMPPSYDVLKKRLTGRNTETNDQITTRLKAAQEEISKATLYDYVILNDNLDAALEHLNSVLIAARFSGNRIGWLVKRILWADD